VPLLLAGGAAWLLAAQANAQVQIAPASELEARAVPIDQITTGTREIPASASSDRSLSTTTFQVTVEAGRLRPAPQLATERPAATGSAQLYTGRRSAEPSEALSSPRDGRRVAVTRIEGHDRCDPSAQASPAANRVCATVIESRAGDYAKPDPTELSPEQRLLVDQRTRSAVASGDASRRTGDAIAEPDSVEAQGIASAALEMERRGQDNFPPESGKEMSQAAEALFQAAAAGAAGVTPQN